MTVDVNELTNSVKYLYYFVGIEPLLFWVFVMRCRNYSRSSYVVAHLTFLNFVKDVAFHGLHNFL